VSVNGKPPAKSAGTGMYYVYILKSEKDGKLCTGSTSDLKKELMITLKAPQ